MTLLPWQRLQIQPNSQKQQRGDYFHQPDTPDHIARPRPLCIDPAFDASPADLYRRGQNKYVGVEARYSHLVVLLRQE